MPSATRQRSPRTARSDPCWAQGSLRVSPWAAVTPRSGHVLIGALVSSGTTPWVDPRQTCAHGRRWAAERGPGTESSLTDHRRADAPEPADRDHTVPGMGNGGIRSGNVAPGPGGSEEDKCFDQPVRSAVSGAVGGPYATGGRDRPHPFGPVSQVLPRTSFARPLQRLQSPPHRTSRCAIAPGLGHPIGGPGSASGTDRDRLDLDQGALGRAPPAWSSGPAAGRS